MTTAETFPIKFDSSQADNDPRRRWMKKVVRRSNRFVLVIAQTRQSIFQPQVDVTAHQLESWDTGTN